MTGFPKNSLTKSFLLWCSFLLLNSNAEPDSTQSNSHNEDVINNPYKLIFPNMGLHTTYEGNIVEGRELQTETTLEEKIELITQVIRKPKPSTENKLDVPTLQRVQEKPKPKQGLNHSTRRKESSQLVKKKHMKSPEEKLLRKAKAKGKFFENHHRQNVQIRPKEASRKLFERDERSEQNESKKYLIPPKNKYIKHHVSNDIQSISNSSTYHNVASNNPLVHSNPSTSISQVREAGINYHGGKIITGTVNIYIIWYGDWSGDKGTESNTNTQTIIIDFLSNIGGSDYWNILSTYSTSNRERVSNSVKVIKAVNVETKDAIDRKGLRSIINDLLVTNALPVDRNGVYLIIPSKDIIDLQNQRCLNYCGYHDYFKYNEDIPIIWSYVTNPFSCPDHIGCMKWISGSVNHNAAADALVSMIAHELAGSVTDPFFTAWWRSSNGQEVADLCSWQFGTDDNFNIQLGSRRYLLQKYWLNYDGGSCQLAFPPPDVSLNPTSLPIPSPTASPNKLDTAPTELPSGAPTVPTIWPSALPTSVPVPLAPPTAMPSSTEASCFASVPSSFSDSISINGVVGNTYTLSATTSITYGVTNSGYTAYARIQHKWSHGKTTWCSGCLIQLYMGIVGQDASSSCQSTTGAIAYDYKLYYGATFRNPGCYYIFRSRQMGYSCGYYGAVTKGEIIGALWFVPYNESDQL